MALLYSDSCSVRVLHSTHTLYMNFCGQKGWSLELWSSWLQLLIWKEVHQLNGYPHRYRHDRLISHRVFIWLMRLVVATDLVGAACVVFPHFSIFLLVSSHFVDLADGFGEMQACAYVCFHVNHGASLHTVAAHWGAISYASFLCTPNSSIPTHARVCACARSSYHVCSRASAMWSKYLYRELIHLPCVYLLPSLSPQTWLKWYHLNIDVSVHIPGHLNLWYR